MSVESAFFGAVSLFCCAAALLGSSYAFFASLCVTRFAGRKCPAADSGPAVTILKPLCGAEPGLRKALESFCTQSYRGPLQFVFGVQSPRDAAIEIVRSLRATHPELDIDLVVDPTPHGANRKIANLINMSDRIRHDTVILADSDIVVAPSYVGEVVAALAAPGVGLVTCLYRGIAAAGFWSRLAAAAIDWHFAPSVLVGRATGLAQPCFGSTIALRRETLAAIGGFEAFADKLADDYEMGAAVRKLGLEVAVPSFVVGHLCLEARFIDLWRHELRWARTIRLVDPAGFFGSGITHALPFAVFGLLLSAFAMPALLIVAIALAARLLLQRNVSHYLGAGGFALALLILRDFLSFAVFVASFFSLRVSWRNFDYKVAQGGTMVPVKEDPET